MNNILIPPVNQRDIATPSKAPEKNPSNSFSQVMTDALDTSNSQHNLAEKESSQILVGEITKNVPTISDLLSQNEKLRGSTWDIIYSEQNKNKDYTKITPGTAVYFSPEDGSLTWSGAESSPSPASITEQRVELNSSSPIEPRVVQHETVSGSELVTLGKIDATHPTVSHLLKNQPDLKEQMWQLLGSSINKDKPYQLISAGTEIQLNPKTMELVWNDNATVTNVAKVERTITPAADHVPVIKATESKQLNHISNNLSDAVQGYKGMPYDEMNCYELLVKGLDNLNIAYSGKNGLYSKLTNMATEKGLAANAYLNGEGIVKAAGSKIFSKNYSKISDWKDKSETMIKEMEPLLGSGQILSFSTEKRGHTGVVGRKDNQWTFINSGRMDNSVDKQTISRGVGEEVLHKEIANWFRSAQRKGETLSVTLGQLNQGTIQTASNISQSYTNRI